MAFKHGKDAEIEVGSDDLSAFTDNVEFARSADSHDTTTFGQDGHTYAGGLTDGTCTLTGTYDDGASGPKAILEAALGTAETITWRPEGTGTGRPEQTFSGLITGYAETAPVAGMIKWKSDVQISGSVTSTDQA